MIDLLKTKFLLLVRKPAAFIIITIVMCAFAYILGLGQQAKQSIVVYSEISDAETQTYVTALQKLDAYDFTLLEEAEAIERVETDKVEVAIALQENGYNLIISADFMNAPLLQNELNAVYSETMQQQAIVETYPTEMHEQVSNALDEAKASPSFNMNYSNFANDEGFKYDAKLQSLFGFTLFLVIYTIANGVNHIVMERRNLIWDRLIISSIRKWEIYAANLTYSFLMGYLQIALVLCIFYFGVGVDFYGGFWKTLILIIPYVLCIVALSIFVASISGTPGKFNAYITVLAVPLAMLGGAYWPLEIVQSDIILALSYISPITYGLELLKGVTINGNTFSELLQPLGLLLFMTVIFMGIGINVLEKKE